MNRNLTISSDSKKKTFAPLLFWIGLGAFLAVPIARLWFFEIDHQSANLAGAGLISLGLLAWSLAAFVGLSWKWFWGYVAGELCLLMTAGLLLEFKGFTGETFPVFGWRNWTKISASQSVDASPQPRGEIANELVVAAARATSTQLLGNSRNGIVDSSEFQLDWATRPPEVLWKRPIGQGWAGTAIRDSFIYTMYQSENEEVIAAIDLLTGKETWRIGFPDYHSHPLGGVGPRATPTLYKNWVVTQTAAGKLVCCDALSGSLLWQHDILKIGFPDQPSSEQLITWGRSGSPLVIEAGERTMVIVPLGGKPEANRPLSLIAFDLESGNEIWRSGTSQISYSSPSLIRLCGVDQIVSINEGTVTGHQVSDGLQLWSASWPSLSNGGACASQPVVVGDDCILLGKGYALGSKLIRVTRQTDNENPDSPGNWSTETVWEDTRTLKTKFTSAIPWQGRLYGLSDGILECVDSQSGKRIWKTGRYGQGQLLMVNEMLLVTTEDGRIALINRDGKLLHEMAVVEGITWNIPSVAGPFLIVRNGEEMACVYSPRESVAPESTLSE